MRVHAVAWYTHTIMCRQLGFVFTGRVHDPDVKRVLALEPQPAGERDSIAVWGVSRPLVADVGWGVGQLMVLATVHVDHVDLVFLLVDDTGSIWRERRLRGPLGPRNRGERAAIDGDDHQPWLRDTQAASEHDQLCSVRRERGVEQAELRIRVGYGLKERATVFTVGTDHHHSATEIERDFLGRRARSLRPLR